MTGRLSRRQFLQYTAWVIGGGVMAVGCSPQQAIPATREPLPMGELMPNTRETLIALVDALVGEGNGSIQHYAPMLDFRAQHTPYFRDSATILSQTLDLAAQDINAQLYKDSPREVRLEILRDGLAITDPNTGRLSPQLRDSTPPESLSPTEAQWMRFHQVVLTEILAVFFETNALILVGYDGWAGQPRGLDAYQRPPSP
jgi:hypothetical protein